METTAGIPGFESKQGDRIKAGVATRVRSVAVAYVKTSRIGASGRGRSCCSILVHLVHLGLKAIEIAGVFILPGVARRLDS